MPQACAGLSLTDYVIAIAREDVRRIVEEAEILRSLAHFAQALIDPPAPNSKLADAKRRRFDSEAVTEPISTSPTARKRGDECFLEPGKTSSAGSPICFVARAVTAREVIGRML